MHLMQRRLRDLSCGHRQFGIAPPYQAASVSNIAPLPHLHCTGDPSTAVQVKTRCQQQQQL